MAKPGQVLEDPKTGDRVIFEATAAETGGEVLRYQLDFRPRGFIAQEHLHPVASERHEVLEGRLDMRIAGRRRTLRPGDVVVVEPGTPHRIGSDDRVLVCFEVRPALRAEILIETIMGLGRDGKINRFGFPSILQGAAIAREFETEGYATRPGVAVQRALFGPLAALARRRGITGWYPHYSDPGVARTEPPAPEAHTYTYVFVDEWDVAAAIDDVFEVVSDSETYPSWWAPCSRRPASTAAPGSAQPDRICSRGGCRTSFVCARRSSPTSGRGRCRCGSTATSPARAGGCWSRSAPARASASTGGSRRRARFLRALTPVLRPLFRWNHNWAIARAIEGLGPYVRGAR